jgi:hypothetical protein
VKLLKSEGKVFQIKLYSFLSIYVLFGLLFFGEGDTLSAEGVVREIDVL